MKSSCHFFCVIHMLHVHYAGMNSNYLAKRGSEEKNIGEVHISLDNWNFASFAFSKYSDIKLFKSELNNGAPNCEARSVIEIENTLTLYVKYLFKETKNLQVTGKVTQCLLLYPFLNLLVLNKWPWGWECQTTLSKERCMIGKKKVTWKVHSSHFKVIWYSGMFCPLAYFRYQQHVLVNLIIMNDGCLGTIRTVWSSHMSCAWPTSQRHDSDQSFVVAVAAPVALMKTWRNNSRHWMYEEKLQSLNE